MPAFQTCTSSPAAAAFRLLLWPITCIISSAIYVHRFFVVLTTQPKEDILLRIHLHLPFNCVWLCLCALYPFVFCYYNNLMKCITYSTLLLLLLSHPTHKSTNCNVQSPVNNGPNPQNGCNCCIKWPANKHWPTGQHWTCYLCLLLPPKTISRLQ